MEYVAVFQAISRRRVGYDGGDFYRKMRRTRNKKQQLYRYDVIFIQQQTTVAYLEVFFFEGCVGWHRFLLGHKMPHLLLADH